MRQLKGILFINGVYRESVKESHLDRVHILWHNEENNKWNVLYGSLDKTTEGCIFKESPTGETYKLHVGKAKNKPEEISGLMDFCLGTYGSDDETCTNGIALFPNLLADYFNGNVKGKIIITGIGTEYREGNCEFWFPLVFRDIERMTFQGFYHKGKFWKITGNLRMNRV